MDPRSAAVAKAARAIFECESTGTYAGMAWDQLSPHLRAICEKYAQAAIEAYLAEIRAKGDGHG